MVVSCATMENLKKKEKPTDQKVEMRSNFKVSRRPRKITFKKAFKKTKTPETGVFILENRKTDIELSFSTFRDKVPNVYIIKNRDTDVKIGYFSG